MRKYLNSALYSSKTYTYRTVSKGGFTRYTGTPSRVVDSSSYNSSDYSFGYDATGNITSVTSGGSSYLTYTYDSAGRIATEKNTRFAKQYEYGYDANNNISYAIEKTLSNITISREDYVYNLDKLTRIDRTVYYFDNGVTTSKTFTTDTYGNHLSYGGSTLAWMQGTRLKSVSKTGADTYEYSYDENGIRYKKERKSSGGTLLGTTLYYLDGARIIAEEREGAMLKYYYDASGAVGMQYGGNYYYFVKDEFGNILKIKNASHTLVAEYEYDAWGNYAILTNVNNIANINTFRYRGYYQDNETGFYYLQTRY